MQFELKLPEIFNAADYFVDRNIREGRGEKIAVLCEDRSLTYSEIQERVNQFGNGLRSLGIRMEDRVALLLPDTEIYPQAFFGAIKMGAVPICLNTLMRPKDYKYFLNDSRARVLVVDNSLLNCIDPVREDFKYVENIIVVNGKGAENDLAFSEMISQQPPDLEPAPTSPDDACFWLYSSGSTGQPKGTVHLHHDMVYASETYGKQVLNIRENDICFSAAKLFFAYGLGNGLYFPFSVGATSAYLPGRPTPEAVFDMIQQYQPTIYFGVPTLYGYLLEQEGEMNGLRLCISAGEALTPEIFKRWKERFGLDIMDGIGSTEMAHIYISNRAGKARRGSTGQIVPGYEARIVDENFHDVPDGDVGTLLVKGDSAAAYYWNKHDKTKETMMGAWLNTGDKFYRDEEGFFYYVGRTNDMLKVGGIWVSPIEVEACLMEHPAVLECGVVGTPDAENLIKPKAFVVLRESYKPSPELEKEMKAYVKKALAHYKYPRWIEFVDELPKTATGKIKRFELKNGNA
ncbi:benzoate-CoA ligase family protein [Desulfonema magnum]|uniref:Benzoate-CoA ligase n=1 Tax=Desulfonema magnum TaxID=45655 RepID=A0A975BKL5_9BACT|nr:benzoate-CoA ligase family protein [Desulfonema magnum]QTA86853.1 Benzoate-CoA ligase [Desulfonema magnum]